MKKFLFTLLAMLMVGTAFADDYWYMKDFEIAQNQLGTNNQRFDVAAHYDAYVSAVQIEFTMPEGLQVRTYRAGSDLTINGYDDLGDPATSTPDLQFLPDHINNLIVASMAPSYDANGNFVGAFHWAPGDYAQMVQVVLIIDANFKGGDIIVKTDPAASGYGDGSNNCPGGTFTKTCHVTVEGATPQLEELTGDIVFSAVDQEDGSFTVTYDGPEEDVVVEVTSMVEKTRAGYTLPDYGTYTVTAKATKDGYEPLEDSADLTWNAPTPQTAQPTVTYEETEDGYLVTVTGDGVLTLVVDDEEVVLNENNQYLIPYTNTPEGEEHTVVATAQVPGELVSEPKVVDIQDPGQTPKPTVTYTETEDGYLVSVTGYGDLTLVVDEEEVELNENNQYLIPYTNTVEGEEHTVVATAQDEGQRVSEPTVVDVQDPGQTPKPTIVYNEDTHTVTVTGYGALNVLIEGYGEGDVITLTGEDQVVYTFELLDDDYEVTVSATAQDEGQRVSDYAIEDFVVPAKEPVTPTTVGAPVLDGYTEDGITGYGVTITPTTEGSQIKYRVLVWDPEANNGEGDWVVVRDWTDYEGTEKEIWYEEENNKYRVEAYAYIGDLESTIIGYEFVVEYVEPTGINEMNAGKTVAGVRYFNMAGQEMQEANGMTIVVTTYTDGTTSAVKVMK